MPVFSKTTFLDGFKHTSNILFKKDGINPFREFTIDENLIPKESEYMEGDWEVTVGFTPRIKKK